MTNEGRQFEMYFAPGPDGQGVEFGRGDVNKPDMTKARPWNKGDEGEN